MGPNEELNVEKTGDLTSVEALVTLLTDNYLSNGQRDERTCTADICIREQIVYFITWQMMELYPPLRGFKVEFDEQTCVSDNKLLTSFYGILTLIWKF